MSNLERLDSQHQDSLTSWSYLSKEKISGDALPVWTRLEAKSRRTWAGDGDDASSFTPVLVVLEGDAEASLPLRFFEIGD